MKILYLDCGMGAAGDMLSAALSPGEPGEAYLRSCGFAPAGETPEGRTLWQACIGFDPLV